MPPNLTRVHVFDVEHGECNIIETPTGRTIMIGAGHNGTTGWRPSAWLANRRLPLTKMVLTNLDRDHASDLPSFEPTARPNALFWNFNINPDWMTALKLEESGRVDPGVRMALHWMKNVFTGGPAATVDYGLDVRHFYHPPTKFQDTNNLSVVTFVFYAGVGIVFPGDLEKAGWEEFLKDPAFRDCLTRTTIFVASHHGRINGYCQSVFGHCTPALVIISDKQIVHDTQDHNCYQNHATGLMSGDSRRKVLTTRNDGKITIDVAATGHYTVYTNQGY